MPAGKFFVRLDLEQICLFLDAHYYEIHGLDRTGRQAPGLNVDAKRAYPSDGRRCA